MRSRIWEKNALKNQYAEPCPYRKTAYTFAGHAPDHVHQLELNQRKLMNVIDLKCVEQDSR
jgi:hypothetical protein